MGTISDSNKNVSTTHRRRHAAAASPVIPNQVSISLFSVAAASQSCALRRCRVCRAAARQLNSIRMAFVNRTHNYRARSCQSQ
jgi:hypothetical protein